MMKKLSLALLLLATAAPALAQGYRYSIRLEGLTDSVLYLAEHRADQIRIVDSAKTDGKGGYTFVGKRLLPTGIYALVRADRKKQLGDIAIEGERKFSLKSNADFDPTHTTVQGSEGNRMMLTYKAEVSLARNEMKAIQARLDQGDRSAQADREALAARMEEFERKTLNDKYLFARLIHLTTEPEVPDTASDKAAYYRMHYWDALATHLQTKGNVGREAITSPMLFNKVNYFFFGHLYYAPSDTICAALDRLCGTIEADTALLRYVLEYITPHYFRSTRNIGWDAVWCHIAKTYYLAGHCPWASEGTITSTRLNYERIVQSLIGAHGQELWMLDTTQIDEPTHWQSSHRQPKPYVVLWFWDPDCHHCQQYTAELKALYDSLPAAERRFEVYAVGYESDVQKWKNYVREHELPFINVGGPNVNIDYQIAYNVHGAPTMIILNRKRDIIMNKVLPISTLEGFLDQYEQQHPTP